LGEAEGAAFAAAFIVGFLAITGYLLSC